MARSVKVRTEFIPQVKAAVQRNGYARQKDLAEELNFSLATVSSFLNGKPVYYLNFIEICHKLALDHKEIADVESNGRDDTTVIENHIPLTGEESADFIYIERSPVETSCYQTLCQPGSLLRIKAPGLMGKTSLMGKILPQVAREGYRIVSVNLHMAEISHFQDLNKFLKWFCVYVGKSLGIPNRLTDYWDEEFSTPKLNCSDYFEKYLLPHTDSPLVLWLDEVERIFPHEKVAKEFLGLLRFWHEQANVRPMWRQLRLAVAHSTEVYVQLKFNESPFNVGEQIILPEFTPEQVIQLGQQYGLSWSMDDVNQLMDMLGGHPHLLSKTCSYMKINAGVNLSRVLANAATEAGIYHSYLRHYWTIIQQNPELKQALITVVKAKGDVCLQPMEGYKLHTMGLVKFTGNQVRIACNLYRHYFSYCLGVD
ncbi:MAG: AAA-like domain-containing protein [Calothrix sp. MO_167.B42]|nr:AAA-like domain-containing protein [Calothrix sp. MO_167.B42]